MASPEPVAITLEALRRVYIEGGREHVVLDGVDARFRRGQSAAIRGRSGSGKSTLLNLIGGIDAPDGGRVIVNGIDLAAMTERARTLFRRRNLGFVYQAFNLIPTLDVADNIRLVLELNGIGGHRADARIRELLGAVGLEGRDGSYPDVLSGGEQQRVAIARALAHRPAVLIADEPTGNLDGSSAASVLALLHELVRANGSTLLIATHSARVAASCDRTFEIERGRLHEVRRADSPT